MKLSATLCLALAVALCYLATVESSPIAKDEVAKTKKELARQSGPVQSPAIPGEADDDDDGKIVRWRLSSSDETHVKSFSCPRR
jgi:hypothetical protein